MIRNGPKRTMSTSGGLELLQMVSELDTERYMPVKRLGSKVEESTVEIQEWNQTLEKVTDLSN